MEPYLKKIKVQGLDSGERVVQFKNLVGRLEGVQRVDVNREKGAVRIISTNPIELGIVRDVVVSHGYRIEADELSTTAPVSSGTDKVLKLQIDGMHCRSCEITVERELKKVRGVKKVDVDASRGSARIVAEAATEPSVAVLGEAVRVAGYSLRELNTKTSGEQRITEDAKRPTFWQLVGLFVLVLIVVTIFSRIGVLKPSVTLGSSMSFTAAFLVGLVAASSSCIAVSGGLLLGSAAKFRERFSDGGPAKRMLPVFLFVAGRITSYAVLGSVIGAVGKALTPSPFVTGLIIIAAALVMLVMGLDMLHLAPQWMKRMMPHMPKALAHRVIDAEGHPHPSTPFLLGAGTFFLPCGFTQALQLYALTTGSALSGGLVLLGFALGTAPALLALGYASSSFKGKVGQFIFRFSGALVIVLGLWNIQNGFTIAGYPLSFPRFSLARTPVSNAAIISTDPNVQLVDGTQVVSIDVSTYGYNPNEFTLTRNVPTRLELSGSAAGDGCLAAFQIPKLKIRKLLNPNTTTPVVFTPTNPGTYTFSCSMGMYRGTFTVL